MRRRFALSQRLGLLAGLVACAQPGHAADWYTGAASPAAREDWIVSVDASTTVTSSNSVFANVGATGALSGTLAQTGPRVRIDALAGTYEYRDAAGGRVTGRQVEGSALVGHEWVWREAKLAGYVGLSVRDTSLSIVDPGNPVVGTTLGVKSVLEFYARPSEATMVSAHGSFTTNDKAYFTRFKAGYEVGKGVYLGPEVAFLGNDFYNQWRVGAHLTGLQLGPVQASLSGGYVYDREQKAGAYGTVDLRAQF